MTDIGTRLRDERIRLGLSQTEFGNYGGVRKNTQSKYESNERAPDALYLANVAHHGVDVQYVITGVRKAEADDEIAELLLNWSKLSVQQKQLTLHLMIEFSNEKK